jgi:hypothetical protein
MNPRQTPQAASEALPCLAPAQRARFQHLQALEDAITYRTNRLTAPCPHCGPVRCDDHATDTGLIAAYRQAAATLAAGHPLAAWRRGASPPRQSRCWCGCVQGPGR